jgi:hypothetical protein
MKRKAVMTLDEAKVQIDLATALATPSKHRAALHSGGSLFCFPKEGSDP